MSEDINEVVEYVAHHVSPVAGIIFTPPCQDDLLEALNAYGITRRELGLREWSPSAWREIVYSSISEYGVPQTIENLYHAARRGWKTFYFSGDWHGNIPPF